MVIYSGSGLNRVYLAVFIGQVFEMEWHACHPLTTQSLERRFKPLKPVLARAPPHAAILALATPLQ